MCLCTFHRTLDNLLPVECTAHNHCSYIFVKLATNCAYYNCHWLARNQPLHHCGWGGNFPHAYVFTLGVLMYFNTKLPPFRRHLERSFLNKKPLYFFFSDSKSVLVQTMAWCSNQWWPSSVTHICATHICVTQSQWVKETHFKTLPHTKMGQVVESFPHRWKGPTHFTKSMPLLLMTWLRNKKGYRQLWYWPRLPRNRTVKLKAFDSNTEFFLLLYLLY